MRGYIVNGMPDKAIALFSQVRNPDAIIITILFNACALVRTAEALNLVKKVASQVPKSSYSDVVLVVSLLDALMKCGDTATARSVFESTTNKVAPMYGAMMKGTLSSRMLNTDVRVLPLVGYIANGMPDNAVDLFSRVSNPNTIIITLLLNACAQLGTDEALHQVKTVTSRVSKSSYSDAILLTSLLDALMRCGDVVAARSHFDASATKVPPMYGAMMKGQPHLLLLQ